MISEADHFEIVLKVVESEARPSINLTSGGERAACV